MAKRRHIIALLVGPLLFASCYTPPEFPIEPSITFKSVIFREVENLPDSLIIAVDFKDGDGDLGLRSDETQRPYNDVWYFCKSQSCEEIITYADRFTPPWDTLPPYSFPHTCQNYSINHPQLEGYEEDTVYFQRNPDHFNIFVQYFVKKNGVYTEFDWETAFPPQCSDSFNGRFPVLTDLSSSPLEGTLRYGMTSTGFKILFRNDTMKLRISVKDRALNDSNVIETPDFVLKDIEVE